MAYFKNGWLLRDALAVLPRPTVSPPEKEFERPPTRDMSGRLSTWMANLSRNARRSDICWANSCPEHKNINSAHSTTQAINQPSIDQVINLSNNGLLNQLLNQLINQKTDQPNHLKTDRLITHSSHQSINCSPNQSTCQSIELIINQWSFQSINSSTDCWTNQQISQTIYWTITQLINQTIDQLIDESIYRLISRSTDKPIPRLSNQLNESPINQLINQTIS